MASPNVQALQDALTANINALKLMYQEGPKPDYSLDGRSYSWTALRKSLLEEQQQLLVQIQNQDINENGGWEDHQYGLGNY